jgi:hypothetical protein
MPTIVILDAPADTTDALLERIMRRGPAAEAALAPTLPVPATPNAGERYAGIVLKEDGTPSHHLFVLPASKKKLNLTDALAWMDSVGSRPTRSEGALVYANLRQHFKKEWHWLGEEFSAGSAWFQGFDHGDQHYLGKTSEFLALAVRRLPL